MLMDDSSRSCFVPRTASFWQCPSSPSAQLRKTPVLSTPVPTADAVTIADVDSESG